MELTLLVQPESITAVLLQMYEGHVEKQQQLVTIIFNYMFSVSNFLSQRSWYYDEIRSQLFCLAW